MTYTTADWALFFAVVAILLTLGRMAGPSVSEKGHEDPHLLRGGKRHEKEAARSRPLVHQGLLGLAVVLDVIHRKADACSPQSGIPWAGRRRSR